MLKKLHLQMTFFCMLITSLILITMTCISLYIAERGTRKNSFSSFKNNASSTLNHLENQSLISHQWIAQMNVNYGFVIDIYDNGMPLLFSTLNAAEYPKDILAQAIQASKDEHALDILNITVSNALSQQVEFLMTGNNGDSYYVSTALLPKDGGYLSVAILYSLQKEQTNMMKQRILFGTVCLIAILLLGVFSWFFTRRMIQPIARSRERQTQFIASASHELRSPLTVILSSLSAMRIASAEEARGFADTIQTEGQRMSRLISDMLVLANADNSTWSITPEPIELDTLVLQTYEKYEPVARDKSLSLFVELPDVAIPRCFCDGERIAQVLSILIDNAFSYTPAGGMVRLSIKEEAGKMKIYVADNGAGISDADKELIFERFYRGDKAHKSKSHFGLGLCIAGEIVKLHKGKIVVKDTPGGGATFCVILPNLSF